MTARISSRRWGSTRSPVSTVSKATNGRFDVGSSQSLGDGSSITGAEGGRLCRASISLDALAERPGPEDTEAAVLAEDETEAALARIAALPPVQAEVVLLRVLAGFEVADVAEIVGKKPGAVRVLQHRALQRLAEQLS